MNNTLLCQTLAAMSAEEFAEFGQMLSSPLFNSTRLSIKCIELYRFFLQHSFKKELTYEQAYAVVYPSKPYNRRLLENVMTALLEVARKYISFHQWHQSNGEFGVQLAMLRFYRERHVDKRFIQTAEKIRRDQAQDKPLLSAAYFFQQYQFETEVHEFENLRNAKHGDINLTPVIENFRRYLVAKGLQLQLNFLHQKEMSELDSKLLETFVNEIMVLARNVVTADIPLFQLLLKALHLLQSESDDPEFELFCTLFELNRGQLSFEISRQFAGIARHYCNRRINQGFRHYRAILFRLYQLHLSYGLLYEQNLIPQANLFNMVNIALGEGDIAWAEEVLDSHRNRIAGSDYPEGVYLLCSSFCHFKKKNFVAAQQSLNAAFAELVAHEFRTHLKDLGLNKMARVHEIKILYEMDPASSLLSDRLNAFKMYLHRSAHYPDDKKNLYNNFVDFLKKLTLPSTQIQPKKAEKLLAQLGQPGFLIADRRWVTEKIEALVSQ